MQNHVLASYNTMSTCMHNSHAPASYNIMSKCMQNSYAPASSRRYVCRIVMSLIIQNHIDMFAEYIVIPLHHTTSCTSTFMQGANCRYVFFYTLYFMHLIIHSPWHVKCRCIIYRPHLYMISVNGLESIKFIIAFILMMMLFWWNNVYSSKTYEVIYIVSWYAHN